MSDDPVRFTDEQRALFRRVAELIRSQLQGFKAAGEWLDAGAGLLDLAARLERNRRLWLPEV